MKINTEPNNNIEENTEPKYRLELHWERLPIADMGIKSMIVRKAQKDMFTTISLSFYGKDIIMFRRASMKERLDPHRCLLLTTDTKSECEMFKRKYENISEEVVNNQIKKIKKGKLINKLPDKYRDRIKDYTYTEKKTPWERFMGLVELFYINIWFEINEVK